MDSDRTRKRGLTLKGVLLRSEAEPATTPLVEQARVNVSGRAGGPTIGSCRTAARRLGYGAGTRFCTAFGGAVNRFWQRSLAHVVGRQELLQLTEPMTTTARPQNAKNEFVRGIGVALVWVVGVALVWVAVAVVFSIALRQSVAQSFRIALSALVAVTFLGMLFKWTYGRLRRGCILLDCGPHPRRRLLVWGSVASFFNGVFGVAEFLDSTAGGVGTLRHASGIPLGVFLLIMAFGRLQVTDRGIWVYVELLPWSEVGSYHWADDSKLLITPKRRSLLPLRCALRVPPEHKQSVDDFLSQFCGVRYVA